MSHFWGKPKVKHAVKQLAVSGFLCACTVTMDEARFSARNKSDLAVITELYGSAFHWLGGNETIDDRVADIRSALWSIGAGRGAQTTDIQIAAVAMHHKAVVVHNDTDFVTIQRAVPELRQLRIPPEDE
jgi:predicted nucleic acid-binding protein